MFGKLFKSGENKQRGLTVSIDGALDTGDWIGEYAEQIAETIHTQSGAQNGDKNQLATYLAWLYVMLLMKKIASQNPSPRSTDTAFRYICNGVSTPLKHLRDEDIKSLQHEALNIMTKFENLPEQSNTEPKDGTLFWEYAKLLAGKYHSDKTIINSETVLTLYATIVKSATALPYDKLIQTLGDRS